MESAPEDLFDPATVPYLREEVLGEGRVIKRVLKEGEGGLIPEDVVIIWAMKEGRTQGGKSFQKYSSFVYKLGKKSTCVYNHGEHLLFASMKRGEECWALVSQGSHQICDYLDQDLWFRIWIEEYLEDLPESIPTIWSFQERKDAAEQCVDIAKRLFGTKKYNHAARLYNRTIQIFQMKKDVLATLPSSALDYIEAMSLRCWKNISVTELKASALCQTEKERLGKFACIIETCKKVLGKTPGDTKALYLMAKAHMMRDEFDMTRKIVAECQAPVPIELTSLLLEIKERERLLHSRESARFQKVFQPNVWESESEKEEEFKQETARKEKLEARTCEQEHRQRRENQAKTLLESTLEKAQKGFVIDLHDPDEDGEKILDMMESVGEQEEENLWEGP